MFQHFTWTQFLITSAVFSLLWYATILLTAYRKEFVLFFAGKRVHNLASSNQEIAVKDVPSADPQTNLMGPSRLPEGLEIVEMGTLSFGGNNSGEHIDDREQSDRIGLVPDVLQELKEVFEVLASEDGTKKDFIDLARMISDKYGRIGSNPNIAHINAFIREHAPFAISPEEIENLWN